MEPVIVPMAQCHVPQIALLERRCFSAPWSETSVAGELTNPLSLWLVALAGGAVVGYVGSQTVLDEADVMNVAVDPAYRRQGVGKGLMLALMAALRQAGVRTLALEVRASNEAAQALYKNLGFEQAGRRPGYYARPREDALILKKRLDL
ncbi:MAG: ribosomal protein S18-alanine N-acetyltransferase [Faecousia sp.]